MSDEKSLSSIFQKKYTEFCDDLTETYSEKAREIAIARALSERERMERFRTEVLPTGGNPSRNPVETPGTVLPGVTIEKEVWSSFSSNTQKAIQEYITLLSFTCMFGDSEHPMGADGTASKAWMDQMLNEWKDKLSKVDFTNLTEKISSLFGNGAGAFQVPEQFLKGQLAKLAEELVREFKPEDFGLDVNQLNETGANPQQAFQMLMNVYTQRPELLQNAMKRIAKRLQEKVQRGELRPRELAAEAEEMMKQFTDNPAFVELMESFRSVFGFEDTEMARAAGRDSDNRRAIAQRHLRQERERREKKKQEQQQQQQQQQQQSQSNAAQPSVEELMRRMGFPEPPEEKKGKKGKPKK
jgi:hypothetical protein